MASSHSLASAADQRGRTEVEGNLFLFLSLRIVSVVGASQHLPRSFLVPQRSTTLQVRIWMFISILCGTRLNPAIGKQTALAAASSKIHYQQKCGDLPVIYVLKAKFQRAADSTV